MLKSLQKREHHGTLIKVGLVGAGSMGAGIAYQLSITPGMQLTWVYDLDSKLSEKAASFDVGTTILDRIDRGINEIDVLVEATNCIQSALLYCEKAIEAQKHVVLMNAEVDLAFGPYLQSLASIHNVIVTSDAGDQHGVLAKMIEEISLWGFKIAQAGNIKGFLNRYATAESLAYEAKIRSLNPVQCCAYTDGSKLNIEMAVLANAYGYLPTKVGMTGPRVDSVEGVMDVFDFEETVETGTIDYVLGAQPGGGVYVVGRCEKGFQSPYLNYYKLLHKGEYYLFYRPYHLCHLETPQAIFTAVEHGEPVLAPWKGRQTEVYAYAKEDFPAGTVIEEAIGGEVVYGMVAEVAKSKGKLPQVVLECEGARPVLKHSVKKHQALSYSDVEWRDRTLLDKYLKPENQPSV